MKTSGNSMLDSVAGGALLHVGGESSIYLLNIGGAPYVLKWYNDGFSFDENVVENVYKVHESGLYRIEEWGRRDGTPYLIYEFVEGVVSDKLGQIPVAVALFALRQVTSTLASLRKQGVSHGDLNPANVIFSADGSNVERAKVAKTAAKAASGLRTVVIDCGIVGPGALAYAAPERFQGKKADEKSDLFSLGLLLYRWIAGEDLVQADGYERFAEQMANVENVDVTEKLYSTGAFNTPEGALLLSALEPLWAGLLRSDAAERVEDFDELDELLEIALDKVEMVVSASMRVVFQLTGTNLVESIFGSHSFRGLISPREAKYGIQVVPSCSTSGASTPEESVVEMRFQASPQSRTTIFVFKPVFLVKRLSLCSSVSCGDAPFGMIQTTSGSCCFGACFVAGAFAAKAEEIAIDVIMHASLVSVFINFSPFPNRRIVVG